MTIGGEGTLNECQTRYTRVENGPTTAGTGKDNRNSGARGMKSTPEICRRRDDHYLTNQYQPQQIQKTRKSICKIGTAKKCLSTNVRYIRKKITSKGLETGNILSYLSEDTLRTFFIFIGRKQD